MTTAAIQVWQSLSIINRLFLFAFVGVAAYTIYLSTRILLQLTKHQHDANTALSILKKRLGNLRQLHLFTLYLFGFCILLSIRGAFETLDNSKVSPIGAYVENLKFLCDFYAPIFLGFVLLHSIQWLASARVNSLLLNSQLPDSRTSGSPSVGRL